LNFGLPKIKKASNRTNANIKIHFGLNDKVPFFDGLTREQDNKICLVEYIMKMP